MSRRRSLCHIVAVAEGGVIGAEGRMPWHVPADLRYFKETTLGHIVIMGRRTFDSIGRKPLPGRLNIVLSRHEPEGVRSDVLVFCPDWQKAETYAQNAPTRWGDRIFIIGGGTLYTETLSHIDRIYLTRLQTKVAGDTFYSLDLSGWQLTQASSPEDTSFPVVFEVYDRAGHVT